jgi:DNA-binding transcriptional LysR family regulator
VVLFERTTRQARLTAAGEVLLRDTRTALEAVTAAACRAREAGSPSPRLRVALKADVDGGLLPQILDAYCADDAALPPELVLGGFGEQAQALRDGLADVGLLLCPFDGRGLDSEPLLTEPLLAALAAADPLAARTRLCLADLAGRRLPGGSAANHGRPAGPRAGQPLPASNLSEIFNLVETGSVVFLRLPRWPGATRDPGSPTGRSATSRTPRWPWPGPRTRARRPSPPSCAPPARSQPPRRLRP